MEIKIVITDLADFTKLDYTFMKFIKFMLILSCILKINFEKIKLWILFTKRF